MMGIHTAWYSLASSLTHIHQLMIQPVSQPVYKIQDIQVVEKEKEKGKYTMW